MAGAPDVRIRGSLCLAHALQWVRQSSVARPSNSRELAALNAAVVQAVTAVLEGLENPVFIAEADPMAPGDACAEAMRRPETPFHDRQ
jgi:hypothetical protein